MLLEAQGYRVGASELYQDIMSALILEKIGKAYSGKSTSHIDIW